MLSSRRSARADGSRCLSRADMGGLEQFFESYYRLNPVNATFSGVHEHDHRLPDWSPEGREAALDEMRALSDSLSVPVSASLREINIRDQSLAVGFLDVQIAEH